MQACLIQWPELVTCPSAQCTEESGWERVGAEGCSGATCSLQLYNWRPRQLSPHRRLMYARRVHETRHRAQSGRLVPRCRRRHRHCLLAFIVALMKRTFSLALTRSHSAAARPWCTFHSPPPPSEAAVCRVQPCLSAACSPMACMVRLAVVTPVESA